MYFKVNQGSKLSAELKKILSTEKERAYKFKIWQKENLPEFNNEVLTQRHPWYLYPDVVAWKFTDVVNSATWQEIKGWPGYYEPKKRTKAGKEMAERIRAARGLRYNRVGFLDMFKVNSDVIGREFVVPTGFVYQDSVYMCFDDCCYEKIMQQFNRDIVEITHGQWVETAKAYNEESKH